jgi:hypothetical protein
MIWTALVATLFLTLAPDIAAAAKPSRSDISEILSRMPLSNGWKAVEIGENGPTSLTLVYSTEPYSRATARSDVEQIITTVIRALVKNGHDPSKEALTVFVFAIQRGFTTVSGKPGARVYGSGYFNYNSDSIVWRDD